MTHRSVISLFVSRGPLAFVVFILIACACFFTNLKALSYILLSQTITAIFHMDTQILIPIYAYASNRSHLFHLSFRGKFCCFCFSKLEGFFLIRCTLLNQHDSTDLIRFLFTLSEYLYILL